MMKQFLATTALVAFASTAAVAQNQQMQTGQNTPVFSEQQPMSSTANGFLTMQQGQILASNLIGGTVYTGVGENAESIGEVDDVVMGPDGRAEAVIISVGGFLGVGEKDVAIPFDRVTWAQREGGERWLTVEASQQELEQAPSFDRTAAGTMQQGQAGMQQDRTAMAPQEQTAAPRQDQARMPAEGEVAQADRPVAPVTTAPATRAADPRQGLQAVEQGNLRAEDLIGATVYDTADNDVGEVGDVILSAEGQIESLIIDVGGFLGMGEKEVAVGLGNVELMRDADGEMWLFTPFTEEQFEAQPEYNEDAYLSDRDAIILR